MHVKVFPWADRYWSIGQPLAPKRTVESSSRGAGISSSTRTGAERTIATSVAATTQTRWSFIFEQVQFKRRGVNFVSIPATACCRAQPAQPLRAAMTLAVAAAEAPLFSRALRLLWQCSGSPAHSDVTHACGSSPVRARGLAGCKGKTLVLPTTSIRLVIILNRV